MTQTVLPLPALTTETFATTAECASLFRGLAQNERTGLVTFRQHAGGIRSAIEHYAHAVSPALIMIEHDAEDNDLFNLLDKLALRCEAGTHLVLLGPANDIRFYQRLRSLGVSEYIALPADEEETLTVVLRLFAGQQDEKRGRLISVIGATGGCGASSLARMIAQFLGEREGSPSILLDLDVAFGSAGFALGLEVDEAYAQSLQTPGRIDKILLERLLHMVGSDLKLLMAPGLAHLDTTVPFDLERIVAAARLSASFTLIDLPHSWTPICEKAIALSDDVLLVAPPTLLGLRNAKMLCGRLPHEPRLILNQTSMRGREEISAARFGEALGLDVICSMRFQPRQFTQAESEGRPVFSNSRKRKVRCLQPLLDRLSPPNRKLPSYTLSAFRFWKRA